ncbi:hypothetical protein PHPALM_29441 [Phytophthora palmivora]|uniref:Uncharacterized protein n=1 Tax=Phytophthora palmivora TaxID=4796 RepID=A0A2P4X7K3_9STRA|nr:hypothetical protein PHPALM_29441 [Phytophthora palmivora]
MNLNKLAILSLGLYNPMLTQSRRYLAEENHEMMVLANTRRTRRSGWLFLQKLSKQASTY